MNDRKIVDEVLSLPLSTLNEKQSIPESLIPYTESANNLSDVYQNINTEYVLSESFTEDEFNLVRMALEGYVESCCEEFSIGSMLPQPGAGSGVDDDDLAELTADPWLDKNDKEKESYKIPGPIIEYVCNPRMSYDETVNDAIDGMIHDPACPVTCCKMSDKMKKPVYDLALMKNKLKFANKYEDINSIRNIEADMIDRKRAIGRLGGVTPEIKDSMRSTSHDITDMVRTQLYSMRFFPTEPIHELEGLDISGRAPGEECGDGSCSECGGKGCEKCGGRGVIDECDMIPTTEASETKDIHRSNTIGGQIKDEFRVAKRFAEDLVADAKAELNIIGGKLRKIEKTYKKQDSDFVPYKKLNLIYSSAKNDGMRESDLKLSRAERKSIYKKTNRRDFWYRNRNVIVMNGKVPWFKYVIDDNGKDAKRHIEFEFSSAAAPWANYYRAVVMKQFGLTSPEIKDWIKKTYSNLHKSGAPEDEPEPENTETNNTNTPEEAETNTNNNDSSSGNENKPQNDNQPNDQNEPQEDNDEKKPEPENKE